MIPKVGKLYCFDGPNSSCAPMWKYKYGHNSGNRLDSVFLAYLQPKEPFLVIYREISEQYITIKIIVNNTCGWRYFRIDSAFAQEIIEIK